MTKLWIQKKNFLQTILYVLQEVPKQNIWYQAEANSNWVCKVGHQHIYPCSRIEVYTIDLTKEKKLHLIRMCTHTHMNFWSEFSLSKTLQV